jgi:superfamily II DNA/RNA helicase
MITPMLTSISSYLNTLPTTAHTPTPTHTSTPTPIQAVLLPLVSAGAHVIARAATGSGKTLCYLIPALFCVSAAAETRATAAKALLRGGGGGGGGGGESRSFDEMRINCACGGRCVCRREYAAVRGADNAAVSIPAEALKRNEQVSNSIGTDTSKGTSIRSYRDCAAGPWVLVIVPTRELSLQVYNNVINMLPCRLMLTYSAARPPVVVNAAGGLPRVAQVKKFRELSVIDMLIGTPGRIIDLLGVGDEFTVPNASGSNLSSDDTLDAINLPDSCRTAVLSLLHLRMLVIDECDQLCTRGFHRQLLNIAAAVHPGTQVVLLSATMPRRAKDVINKLFSRVWVRDSGNIDSIPGITLKHKWAGADAGYCGCCLCRCPSTSLRPLYSVLPRYNQSATDSASLVTEHCIALTPPPQTHRVTGSSSSSINTQINSHIPGRSSYSACVRADPYFETKLQWLCRELPYLLRGCTSRTPGSLDEDEDEEGINDVYGGDSQGSEGSTEAGAIEAAPGSRQVIVFVRTREEADVVVNSLRSFVLAAVGRLEQCLDDGRGTGNGAGAESGKKQRTGCSNSNARRRPELTATSMPSCLSPALQSMYLSELGAIAELQHSYAGGGASTGVNTREQWVTSTAARLSVPQSMLRAILADSAISCVHSDMAQHERTIVLSALRSAVSRVVVATDVLGRGIDLPFIGTIVNLDCPGDIESYMHRLGRCGRPGQGKNEILQYPMNETECI